MLRLGAVSIPMLAALTTLGSWAPAPIGIADLSAQEGRVGASSSERDFLFGPPRYTIGARLGLFRPRAESQFHDFVFDRFTLGRDDLVSGTGGIEAGVWFSDHLEATVSLDGAGATRESEYRDWEEPTGDGPVPIRQTTRLVLGPTLTVGGKLYPLARGERLSRFVWVPRRAVPFVSAGLGGTAYQLEQWGDWVQEPEDASVDEAEIFTEEYRADGAGLVTYLGGGMDVLLRPRVALVVEGRYFWGEARMRDDFRSFLPLDLSGFRLTAGLAYRF